MRIHPDCPFTKEELQFFKACLYDVNQKNKCVNPAHMSWFKGYIENEGNNQHS